MVCIDYGANKREGSFPKHSSYTYRPMEENPRQSGSDSVFHAVDSGFQVLDSSLFQWNLDFGFQSLV